MSIIWQQRIAHFDRPVKRRQMRGLGIRLSSLKRDIRERRGYPSDGHSSEYTFARLRCRIAERRGEDTSVARARLAFIRLRERMLGRKKREKAAAKRRRRPSVADTRINLAKRRREWLAKHDETQARWKADLQTAQQDAPA